MSLKHSHSHRPLLPSYMQCHGRTSPSSPPTLTTHSPAVSAALRFKSMCASATHGLERTDQQTSAEKWPRRRDHPARINFLMKSKKRVRRKNGVDLVGIADLIEFNFLVESKKRVRRKNGEDLVGIADLLEFFALKTRGGCSEFPRRARI